MRRLALAAALTVGLPVSNSFALPRARSVGGEYWQAFWLLVVLAAVIFGYVAPCIIAFYHKLQWRWAIAAINIGLGLGAMVAPDPFVFWAVFGWVIALVLALFDFVVNGPPRSRRSE